jgi:hypothetical protein
MGVAYIATVGGMEYGFDFEDQRIDVDDRVTRLSVYDLYAAIKDAQDSEPGISYPVIADASGLDELSEGITTFITVKLFGWEVNTLKVSGKFEVAGGNLIRSDGQDPFRDNPLITYINFISQAGVRATFSTGSGLSAEQNAKLMAIPTVTLTAEEAAQLAAVDTRAGVIEGIVTAIQAAQLTASRFISLMFRRSNTVAGDKITQYRAGDELDVAVTYNAQGIPTSEAPQ